MTLKLYEATEALGIVDDFIAEHADAILANGGALTPELAALLDQADGDFREKAERVALKVRTLEAEAAAIAGEVDRLHQRATVAGNAAKSLKAYLLRCLLETGTTQVKGTLITIAVQKNPPKVVTTRGPLDDAAGDAGFVTVVPERREWDKDALKRAAKAGEALPDGVTVVQEMGLRLR